MRSEFRLSLRTTGNNKSAQSNLGRRPRRGGVAHGAGLWPACVAETRWASVAWRSFMNMAKLNWLS